ncbi:conserved hypothetical protein [Culex quinquefasciatus]|uniref:Uncharacterized protein n=1 Tax=Culex quinquefasciatus TaxID=7176 RepID=B0WB58_CULQU|nr:conserved hypothetical protein [Culex quinquefasciatus]|eukprot:XP_001845942.1 conserved hypothetical protein [Culex quinquefasciatus]
MLPPDMLGLTDEQVEELKLVDEWGEKCVPSGGWVSNADPVGRRNGRQPLKKMQDVLEKAVADAKLMITKKLVEQGTILQLKMVQDALDLLRGAVMIVYPMQLPPHDPIRMEFSNTEDLEGTQASLEVIEPCKAQLWFAGKLLPNDAKLRDVVGGNEKTKIIVKLAKVNEGAPGREPVVSEEARKQMMMHAYRRQEELKTDRRGNENNYDGIPQPVQLCWPLINKYVMTMSCSTNLVDCWWCAGDDARGCIQKTRNVHVNIE